MNKVNIIGITGATGAGKSTVTRHIAEKGIPVIDADLLAREVVGKDSVCLQSIASVFGTDILNADGTLHRKALARKAFASTLHTQKLNEIIHPFIIMETLKKTDILRKDHSVILLDAPLLFECYMDILCRSVIGVVCEENIRLERIMKRDGLTENEARQRMSVQHDSRFYCERSDFVIDGGKPLKDVYACADSILKKLTER